MLQSANDAARGARDRGERLRTAVRRPDERPGSGARHAGHARSSRPTASTTGAARPPATCSCSRGRPIAERGFARIVASQFRDDPRLLVARPRRVQNRNALLWLYPRRDRGEDRVHRGGGVLPDRDRRARRPAAGRDRARRPERAVLRRGDAARPRVRGVPGGDVRAGRGGDRHGRDPRRRRAGRGRARDRRRSCRRAQLDRVRAARSSSSPDAVFPPAPGERVGTIKVDGPRRAAWARARWSSPRCRPPPPTGDDPWWARAAGAVGEAVGDAIDGLIGWACADADGMSRRRPC